MRDEVAPRKSHALAAISAIRSWRRVEWIVYLIAFTAGLTIGLCLNR
jgi:hypothetical protein